MGWGEQLWGSGVAEGRVCSGCVWVWGLCVIGEVGGGGEGLVGGVGGVGGLLGGVLGGGRVRG